MTNEEAIEILKDLWTYLQADIRQALEMAIQSLEQEPSGGEQIIPQDHDGCKDCVYQANPQDAMPCRECKHNYMDKFERAKVGHWKEYSSNWLCDYCNRLVSERSDYCPHCGAKMD